MRFYNFLLTCLLTLCYQKNFAQNNSIKDLLGKDVTKAIQEKPKITKSEWLELVEKAYIAKYNESNIQIFIEAHHFFMIIKDVKNAYDVSEKLLNYLDNHNLEEKKGQMYVLIGSFYRDNLLYEKAMDYYLKGLDIAKKYKDNCTIYSAYFGLGFILYTSNPDKSTEYMLKSLEYKDYMENSNSYISSINTIALVYRNKKNIVKSLEYFQKALDESIKYKNNVWQSIILGNIAFIFKESKDYDNALKYSLQEVNLLRNNVLGGHAYLHLANIYTLKKDLFHAKAYLDTGLVYIYHRDTYPNIEHINIHKEDFLKADIYRNTGLIDNSTPERVETKILIDQVLRDYYREEKNFQKAYIYFEELAFYSDSITHVKYNHKIEIIRNEYEFKQQEDQFINLKKMLLLQKKVVNKQTIINAVLAALLLITIISLYIMYKHHKKVKKLNDLINKKKHEVIFQNKLLQEQKNDLLNLNNLLEVEIQTKQEMLEKKSKELLNHALMIAEHASLIEDLKKNIASLPLKISDSRSILQKINLNHLNNKDWHNFQQMFDDVNPQFFKHLSSVYPDLSAQELKLCALIKLNISSKEIASILRITPESVYTARYRIRKKMGMDDTNLNDFLFKL